MWGFSFIDRQENHSFLPIIVEGRDVTRYYFSVMQSYGELPESRRATEPPFLLCHKHSFLCAGLFLMPCLLSAPLQPSREAEQGSHRVGPGGTEGVAVAVGVSCHSPLMAMSGQAPDLCCMPVIAPSPSRLGHGYAPRPSWARVATESLACLPE